MPFASARLIALKDRATESKGGDLYLNPGSLTDGQSVRFSPVGDKALDYYEIWVDIGDKRKPLRFAEKPTDKELAAILEDNGAVLKEDKYGRVPYPKLAMAFWAWNYETSSIQLFSANQVTILETLASLMSDEDVAADPGAWDFELSRTGTADTTRYSLILKPGKRKGAVAKEVQAAWEECEANGYNLQALLVGGDPFKPAGEIF